MPRSLLTPWSMGPIRRPGARRASLKVLLFLFLGLASVPCASARGALKADAWTVDHGLPQNTVTAITQDRDGYLWVATRKGLARFDGLVFQPVGRVDGIDVSTLRLTAVLADSDGSLWIGSYGLGLLRLHNGRLQRYGPAEGVPDSVVWDLTRDQSGQIWLATGAGARYLSGNRWEPVALPDHVRHDSVNTVFRDRRERIWLGTSTRGAVRIDGNEVVTYDESRGLPVSRVFSFGEDAAGTLWAATPRGVARLDEATGHFVQLVAPEVAVVYQLRTSRDGALWMATHGHGLVRYDGRTIERFSVTEGVTSDFLLSVFEDRDGSLWMGTVSGGLNRLARVPRKVLNRRNGLPPFPVTTVYQDPQGTHWVGTQGGGIATVRDDRAVRVYTTADGLPSNRITSVSTAGLGQPGVWVGTDDAGAVRLVDGRVVERIPVEVVGRMVRVIEVGRTGVFFGGTGLLKRGADGHEQRWTRASGLGADEIRVLYMDDQERLWIGTYGGGLNRLDPDGSLKRWGVTEGLTNPFVTSIHIDASGTVWIGTYGDGLFRLTSTGTLRAIDERHGLEDGVVFDIMEDRRERLWLMMNEGLSVITLADANAVADRRQATLTSTLLGAADGVSGIDGTDGNQPQSWLASDGRLRFATALGVVVFDPDDIDGEHPPPATRVDTVTVNQRELPLDALDSPLDDRNVDIQFSAAQLRGATRVRYQYRLMGFDDTWSPPRETRSASFTNLRPGQYRFEVRARASDGGRFGVPAVLALTVAPRYYEQPWFPGLALLVVSGLAFAGHRMRIARLHQREHRLQQLVDTRTAALRHEMAERERAEGERRVLDERMQQTHRLESLGVLAGGIAHDFNNLLVGVLGEAGLALAALPPGYEARVHLQRIEHAAIRAGELTAQMLAFSGRGRFVAAPVEVPDVVRDTVRLLSTVLGQQVRIDLDFPADLPRVLGDPPQIRQVVMNLLTNASDAIGDRPGRIRLSAGVQQVHAAMAAASTTDADGPLAEGSYVWLAVEDDGAGMDAATMERIFEPFFTTKFTGRGLGLAATRGIVSGHGGRIHVRSTPGEGTVFSVLVPAAPCGPEPPTTRPSAADGRLPARRPTPTSLRPTPQAGATSPMVLVVDDEPAVRDVARASLHLAGYRVEVVPTGEAALDRFASAPDSFQMVLLDLTLPRLSGRAVFDALRAMRPSVPVLLTSGFTADAVADLAAQPATGFLPKPWRPQELADAVARLLPGEIEAT